MGDEGVDVRSFEAVAFQQLQAGFGLFAHGELEDLLAVLMNVVHFLVDGFMRGGIEAASAGHLQEASAGAVDFVDEIDQSYGIVFGGFEDYGARSVAEDHAGCTVGVIDDRRHYVGADDQDSLMSAGRDELRSRLDGVDEGGTGGGDIESPNAVRAQLVLNQAGGRGEKHVGRDRAYDDGVDVVGSE